MNDVPPVEAGPPQRECGGCVACCTVLAVDELHKPMRWACDHVGCGGCQVYETRPKTCRQFDCLWLRGGLADDPSLRPDRLGVIFDSFERRATGDTQFVALEVWTGAFESQTARELLAQISATREVVLSNRDGSWRTLDRQTSVSPTDGKMLAPVNH